jgi:hypothetical protein
MEARPGLTSISVTHPSHAAMKIAPRRCHLNCRGANYSNATGRCRYFFEGGSRRAGQILLDPGRLLKRLSADLILTSPSMHAAINRGRPRNGGRIERD